MPLLPSEYSDNSSRPPYQRLEPGSVSAAFKMPPKPSRRTERERTDCFMEPKWDGPTLCAGRGAASSIHSASEVGGAHFLVLAQRGAGVLENDPPGLQHVTVV